MDRNNIGKWLPMIAYLVLGLGAILTYKYAIGLMTIQSAWFNTVMGKASASTVILLIMWVIFIEGKAKSKAWGEKKTWALLLGGIFVLMLSIHYTPL